MVYLCNLFHIDHVFGIVGIRVYNLGAPCYLQHEEGNLDPNNYAC